MYKVFRKQYMYCFHDRLFENMVARVTTIQFLIYLTRILALYS